MRRAALLCSVSCLALLTLSCGGSSSLDDTEAPVFITVEVELYNPDIDICSIGGDMTIETMNLLSIAKDPGGTLGPAQDVTLDRWVVTPYRTDGGSTASPAWSHDLTVLVPAGGSTDLENYRIYPAEYLNELPLTRLRPENGGVDTETGNANIRQSFRLQIYGRTMAGQAIATQPISIAFNFTCGN